MKIAAVQLNPTIGDLKGNALKIAAALREARSEGAELIIFPEMALTGYPPRDLLLYSAFLDETERILRADILPLTDNLFVLLGVPWQGEGEFAPLYNAALLLSNGEITSCHFKTLLPNYDVFDEHRYFTPAPVRKVARMAGIMAAVTICEDMWNDKDYWQRTLYPQDPVAELLPQGAGLLINISASPYHAGKGSQREEMVSALASKYRVPLLYVNQVGGNDELIFDGSSLVCSADGSIMQRARPFQEDILYSSYNQKDGSIASLNKLQVKRNKKNGHKNLEPSGVVSEKDLQCVFDALCLGLGDYVRKSGFSSVVLGLSGGIDSAVTAATAVETLGPESVLGVLMPSPYSSPHSVEDAQLLAQNLGIERRIIPIHEPFDSYISLLSNDRETCLDLAAENIQARIRGNILMFISNREQRLLLTTGNKSELAVGYCTLYGDMCGGLAVLADVPKNMVYRLAGLINERAGRELIPSHTISKTPSAELRPDQRDEDSLPPYTLLDQLLHLYLEENLHIEQIVALGYERELVKEIVGKVDKTEYKRFQAAPGLRVTTRAFGSGRRMPLSRGYFYDGGCNKNALTHSAGVG